MSEHHDNLEARLRSLRPTAPRDDLAARIAEHLDVSPVVVPDSQQRPWAKVAAWAAAACLLIGLVTWSLRGQRDDVLLASSWNMTPSGDVEYQVLTPTHLQLTRGEVHLVSNQAAQQVDALLIETPHGKADAAGGEFYVGVHTPLTDNHKRAIPQETKGTEMNSLTRVLVLAGTVTLNNALGSVSGQTNELISSDADQQPTKLVVEANSDFAIELYRQLARENQDENLFFSPYSISSVLAMAAEGARGQTAAELGSVLSFPEAARRVGDDAQLIPWQTSLIHTGLAGLNRRLKTQAPEETEKLRQEIAHLREQLSKADRRQFELRKKYRHEKHELKKTEEEMSVKWSDVQAAFRESQELTAQIEDLLSQVEPFQLHIANSLWGEQSYPFNQSYLDTINTNYDTGGVFAADFQNSPEVELERINRWVEQQTQDRIKDIFPEGSIDPLTRLVLVNAIYFKGEWQSPFDPERTKPLDFTSVGGATIRTPIMSQSLDRLRYGAFEADGTFFKTPKFVDEGANYPDENGFGMVELPYKGDTLSMVLIAPNRPDGIAALEQLLTTENLTRWISQCRRRETFVLMPKFKLSTKYFLNQTLAAMGMPRAFDMGAADFSGMSSSTDPGDALYLSQAIHQTFLEVNEKGTEAAAATGATMALRAIPRKPLVPRFAADRPFIFLIRDVESGHVLFMGRMMNPESAE